MSYSDYSYQQPSSGFDAGGSYSSTYSQGQTTYDNQFSTSEQISPEKDQTQYSQYDYSYSSSYQQSADTTSPTTGDYYSSSNDYNMSSSSYNQQDYVQPSSSSGYDTSGGYQTSSYQYSSNAAEPDTTVASSSQGYSSTLGSYDYSTGANIYNDSATDQYDQSTSSYNYGTNQTNSYDSQQSYSQPQQTSSSYSLSSSQQYSKPSNDYSQSSDFGGSYLSSNDGMQSGSYQSPGQSRSSGYSQRSSSGAGGSQSSQPLGSGSYRQVNDSGSRGGGIGGGSGSTGSFQNMPTYGAVGYDDAGFGGYSGPATGFSQNRKSDVWSNSNSSGGVGSGGGGSGHFKAPEESFGGFSYNPKRDHGNSNSFSVMDHDSGFSRPSSSNFSSRGGSQFNSSSGGSSFGQRGVSSRGGPMMSRNNMENQQGRMNYNSSMGNESMSSGGSSWRSPRGGGPQGRGGFNNSGRGDQFNNRPSSSSSMRGGGKFNNGFGPREHNNRGFSDNRGGGNQFHSRNNQNSFHNDRDTAGAHRPPVGSGPDAKKMNESAVKKPEATPQTDQGVFHTNIVKKVAKKEDSGSKAPFYPNQKLLNEVESKTKPNDKAKQPTSEASKLKAMTQDVRKEIDLKKKEIESKTKEAVKKTPTKVDDIKVEEKKQQKPEQPAKVPILAPPKKSPETPEEIAREEEIQRKILASIVVLDPDKEKKLLQAESDKKVADVEMPEDLREILNTLTTDHYCKLCNVRLAPPQMPVHYNGKNHLKKVRIFVQTNGRSAGFNQFGKTDDSDKSKSDGNAKAEEEQDEKKFCKVCSIAFQQEAQSEIHYNGKNHAKKLRQANNVADSYECKICSVQVSSQEVLTAHLNGAPHKQQLRKMEGDNPHRGGLQGRGGYRGGGRGGRGGSAEGTDGGFRGRGMSRGRGRGGVGGGGFFRDEKLRIKEDDEELYNLLGLTPEKRYKFDLANFRTPSGKFYCSSCDVVMEEEPHFLLHLGSKKHRDKAYKPKKDKIKIKLSSSKREKTCGVRIKVERDLLTFNRNH